MKIALVLSGGGAKGAFEAGVVSAMYQAGIEPTIFSGTSAGALNSAALASGMSSDQLEELWRSLGPEDVFRLRSDLRHLIHVKDALDRHVHNLADRFLHTIGWTWLLDTTPLRETLIKALGSERVPVVDDKVLSVSAIDVLSGRLARFASREPPRSDDRVQVVDFSVDHLLASSAIPLLFPPVEIAGAKYWDGGLLSNTPLAAALAYRPDAAIVVMTSPPPQAARQPSSLGEAIGLVLDDLLRASLHNDLRQAQRWNEVIDAASDMTGDGNPLAGKRRVDILTVELPSTERGPAAMLDFDPEQADQLIRLGRDIGSQVFATWLGSK